jgi:PAS domain S-box-containing protein
MQKTTRILVVDDEPGAREVYSLVLGAGGYEVSTAATGQEALERVHAWRPHLVLLDVVLPEMSGVEVCRRIKADPALADVFVVLLSGHTRDAAERIEGLEIGADDYLVKTMERGELLARIRTVVRLRDTTAALRTSEERYRQLAENIREVFWMTDPAKNEMLFVSPAYEEIWGRTCQSLYASPWDWVEAIHPEDRDRVLEAARTKQAAGQYNELYRITRPDGSIRWIQDRAFPIRDASGAVYRVVGIAEDVTTRQEAELQLAMLANAVQSTQEMISITNAENHFTFVNEAFVRAYGYTSRELLGKTPDMLFSSNNPPGLLEQILEQTLAGGWRGEVLDRRKDGTEFPISLSTSVIRNKTGDVLGLIGVARDISERRRAEKQFAAFAQLGHRLSAAATRDQAASIILDIASGLFGWDAGYIDLYSEADDKLIWVLTVDTIGGKRTQVPPHPHSEPSPLMRLVMKEGARLINQSDRPSIPVEVVPFGDTRRRSASKMYVPIRSEGLVQGILSIQSYTPDAYSEADLQVLQTLADHCGAALQRIKVTEALREAEANYRSLFENATEGIFQTTPNGRLLSANPALARMFGYPSPAEMVAAITNVAAQVYVTPKSRALLKQLLQAQGYVQGFEAENYRKDGSRIWISLNGHLVRNAAGKVLHYQGTIQDITERRQAQQRLADALELNQAILATSAVGLTAYRKSGECVFANEAAGRILGATVPQLLRRNFRQLPAWKDCGLLELAEKTLRTRNIQSREIHLATASGKKIWLDCHMASFVSGGEPHLLVVKSDITRRKRAEEELRQLSRRVIAAQETERLRVARELHDSVNQVIASAKMRLHKSAELVASLSPAANEILARCERLLVRALEENRRIAHNLRPSELDQLGLPVACRSFCQELQSRTNLEVTCKLARLSRRLPPAVELNLFRILQETLNNVEKHARARNVQVRLFVENGAVLLRIQDDGRGFRPEPARRGKPAHSGIGLTNISERAASVGGTCEIDTAPGKGTTITVRVPCQTPRSSTMRTKVRKSTG